MTAVSLDELPRARHADAPTHDVAWWGMALLCATEGTLFACMLFGYFYLGVESPHWPPAGIEEPTLLLPGIMTALLLASSGVLRWAELGIRAGDRGRLRLGLGVTVLLGLVFLGLQAREYHEKLQHFLPQSHAYGSLFYTITGFHGVHVAVGLLLLLYTEVRAMRGHFSAANHRGIGVVALYWHFVDGVWLFVFTSLYLSPRLY